MEIWAHRGDHAHAPENTLPAFVRAAESGAEGVELDARLAANGEIVVLHDPLSAPREAEIPSLRAVYELLRPTALSINVELKSASPGHSPLEKKCVALAREMDMAHRVIYSSFNPQSLARLLEAEPSAQAALLCRNNLEAAIRRAKEMGLSALHPRFPLLYQGGAMEKCAEAGLIVRPWTVNDMEDMKILNALGVHALITDFPALALRARAHAPDAPRNL